MVSRVGATAKAVLVWSLCLGGAACTYKGRLADYDFTDRSIALVTTDPGPPQLTQVDGTPTEDDDDDDDGISLFDAVVWVAASVYESHELDEAEAKLHTAGQLVDVATVVADNVLPTVARELGVPVVVHERDADYTLWITVQYYGLDVAPTSEETGLTVVASADLIDPEHPEPIWTHTVEATDAGGPGSGGSTENMIFIGIDLATTSAEDMAEAFERLALVAAEELSEKFRESMEAVRDD